MFAYSDEIAYFTPNSDISLSLKSTYYTVLYAKVTGKVPRIRTFIDPLNCYASPAITYCFIPLQSFSRCVHVIVSI